MHVKEVRNGTAMQSERRLHATRCLDNIQYSHTDNDQYRLCENCECTGGQEKMMSKVQCLFCCSQIPQTSFEELLNSTNKRPAADI